MSEANPAAGLALQDGECLEYYAIPVTKAVTLGYGQLDANKGFIPFLFDKAGFEGFVIRIPQPNLISSACSPKPSLPSRLADARTGISRCDFPALLSQDNASALGSELPTSTLDSFWPRDNYDQLIYQNIPSGGYDPSHMPSALANGFSPRIHQTQDPFAMNVESNLSVSYIQESSMAGREANLESPSKSNREQPIKSHKVLSAETLDKRIRCDQPGCSLTFSRHSDRIRHRNTVHQASQAVRLCPVAGCTRSRGIGFSRADKLTEHLWKIHADLGYKKAGS